MSFLKKWSRLLFCMILVAAAMAVYVVRLAQWQLVRGEEFSQISQSSTNFFVKLNAARGELLDRNGEILAGNRTTYRVVMNAMAMDDDRNPAILAVLNILRQDEVKWVDRLPILLNEEGKYEFMEDRDSEIAALKSPNMLNMQEYATAEECMKALISRYNCAPYTPADARDIISVRYNMTRTQFNRSEPYVIAEDVPMETVERISERASSMPGVEIRVSTVREYDDGTTAPHIIGNLGAITQEQYDAFAAEGKTYSSDNVAGYSYTEILGQSGAERAFESILRGTNGKETVITNGNGDVVSTELSQPPIAGNTVYLTLDTVLQRTANESLARNIAEASKEAKDCIAGAAVVLDVKTFGVLAAASYPSYDLGLYQSDYEYYESLTSDERRPLFNRAFDGIFTPGSVFKPLVAIAALNEGIIDPDSTVFCNGVYDYYKDENPPTCLGTHGNVNVLGALQHSCNVFFYDVGRRLTVDKMDVYADLFALGSKTGVEISEASGIMSGKQEYQQNHGVPWIDGLTIQTAIGQCDSMFSPLQLATYCATIANDGVRLKTHLLDKVTDYDGQKVVDTYQPEVMETVEVPPQVMQQVQQGMAAVCEYGGTGYRTFGEYGVKLAAKTGTAEIPGHSDNVVFIAYAPYDDPQIALAVVLEYGKSGVYPQAVAKDIFDKYFYGETELEKEERLKREEEEKKNQEANGGEGADGNETSGTDGNETSGTEGNETSGTEGNETSGTEGNGGTSQPPEGGLPPEPTPEPTPEPPHRGDDIPSP